MNTFLIIIILILLAWLYIKFKAKCDPDSPNSTPSSFFSKIKSNFNETITDTDDDLSNINDDDVLIIYAPWCGHCKTSMPEFLKAKRNNKNIKLINSEEYPDLVKKYNVTGYPTIKKASGEKYTGQRDSVSISNFAKS